MISSRAALCAGAALGLSGVVLGAWGAHGLAGFVGHTNLSAWETGVLYQFIHALGLLLIGILLRLAPSPLLSAAAVSFALGVLLFSGSLYALILGAPGWLGPVTPIGGLALIVGWLCLFAAVARRS